MNILKQKRLHASRQHDGCNVWESSNISHSRIEKSRLKTAKHVSSGRSILAGTIEGHQQRAPHVRLDPLAHRMPADQIHASDRSITPCVRAPLTSHRAVPKGSLISSSTAVCTLTPNKGLRWPITKCDPELKHTTAVHQITSSSVNG